jgi:hypothetical protein
VTDDEVLHAVESRCEALFDSLWDRLPKVAIVYENTQARNPPPPMFKLFVEQVGALGEAYAGSRIDYTKGGLITAQIFVHKGLGTTQPRQIGAIIEKIYAGQTFSGIICRECTLLTVRGIDRANAELSQFNARIPFEYSHSITYGV